VAGKIMSMKNFNDIIGNRTHNPPACSSVAQTHCATSSVPTHVLRKLMKNCYVYVINTGITWQMLAELKCLGFEHVTVLSLKA
jgi:hypothetical protein